jgi:hypothetical protein
MIVPLGMVTSTVAEVPAASSAANAQPAEPSVVATVSGWSVLLYSSMYSSRVPSFGGGEDGVGPRKRNSLIRS